MTKVKSKVTHTYTFDQVDSVIAVIVSDGMKLQQKIHNLGVCIFKHWHDHQGDKEVTAVVVEKINALVAGSGYHKSAVAAWVQTMSPIKYSDDNKSFYAHVDDKMMGKMFMALRDKPFWECKPPAQVKSIDLLGDLMKEVAKAQKRVKEPKEGVEDSIDTVLLRDVVTAIEAGKARAEKASRQAEDTTPAVTVAQAA